MSNTDPNRCACGNRKPINRAVCTECPEPIPCVVEGCTNASRMVAVGVAEIPMCAAHESIYLERDQREPTDREGDVHREGAD